MNALPVLLGEPGPGDHGEFLSEMPKKLWAVRYDDHGFLHSASGHVCRTVQEPARVHLPGT